MSDHYSIRIRDQIATQIAATSYTVHTSRNFALEEEDLPAVCVVVGDDSIEQEAIGDSVEHHEQDFKLHFYAADAGDVDREVLNTVKTAQDALRADESLGGLVDYSYTITVSEIARDSGTKKLVQCEVTYRTIYTN